MKGRIVFGALLLTSVALCSQGFGFELLDNMLGLNRGCGSCCEQAPCDPCEKVKACAPEPACCGVENPGCCAPRRPVCDLFNGLKGLFCCKPSCKKQCCDPCDPCGEVKACAPEPQCCDPCDTGCGPCAKKCRPRLFANLCKPVCKPACEPACEPTCEPACNPCKPRCCKPTPVRDFLEKLFSCCNPRCKKSCCKPACGEGCEVACGGCGVTESTAAPAKAAPAEEAAPLPAAPKADPSASLQRTRNILQASRDVVQN